MTAHVYCSTCSCVTTDMQDRECTSAKQWLTRSKAIITNKQFCVSAEEHRSMSAVEQEHKQAWNAALVSVVGQGHKQAWSAAAVSVQCTDLMEAWAAS